GGGAGGGGEGGVHQRRGLGRGGEQDTAGEQQVERSRRSEQPRQDPGDAVLGHQAAAGEGGGELGLLGGEAQVAHQRLDQANARARAVDRGQDRLWKRQRQWLRDALLGRPGGRRRPGGVLA